jgi:hypothetical protein
MFFAFYFCMLVLLAAWVSLPLYPAVTIYKRFPHAPLFVTGPLAGNLTINTGGAFAAYFVVLAVITPFVNSTRDAVRSATRPYWEISGEVTLVDEAGKEVQAIQASDKVVEKMMVQTRPDILGHDGTFLRFKLPEADDEGHLPSVILSFPQTNWSAKRLDFSDSPPWWMFWKWFQITEKRDSVHKTINIGKVAIHPEKPPRTYLSLSDMDRPPGGPPQAQ